MLTITAELIDTLPTPPDATAPDGTTPIDQYTDRALPHCAGLQDGAGNTVEGWSSLQGNDTLIAVFRVDHTSGARTALATVLPPPTFKVDSFTFWQSGPNLIVGLTAHEAVSSPTRANIYARAVVPGVLVPYGPGAEPRGAFIDPALLGGSPAPAPNPTPGPIDFAPVQAMITAALTTLVSDFGGTSVRDGLQQKAEDGLVWLLTVSEADAGPRWSVAQRYREALFAFHRNLVGAQLWEFAIRSGQVPPSAAPDWVHGLPGYPWGR